jgi:hypothetical protein
VTASAAPGGESAGPRLPVVRVRLRCSDKQEFRARYARAIAAYGVFAPAAQQRAVGARVELVLELGNHTVVRGEAIVVDAAGGRASRPGTAFRFVRLEEGSLEYEETPPPRAATDAAAGCVAPQAAPREHLEGPFSLEEQRELLDVGAVVDEPAADREPEPTIEVPLRRDVLDTRAAMDAASAAEATARRARARRRGARLLVASAAGVVAVALATYLVATSRSGEALDAELRVAEERLADGRLSGGGDSALDHLVAARGLAPNDLRVRERLRLVADKLEQLAESALARGDYAEAAVHLTAATQADPGRRSLHERLGEIAKGRPGARRGNVGHSPTR